jgi:hypothetical protein
VVLQTAWRFRNGTEVTSSEISDVSGVNENITSSLFVYAANLTANGRLFPLATDLPWVINETAFRVYGGEYRAINHIEVNRTDIEGEVYSHLSLYFDKQTGILVESTSTDVYSATPNQVFTRHLVLKESNVWVVPEFPTLLAVPLLMATTAAAALLYKRKQAGNA